MPEDTSIFTKEKICDLDQKTVKRAKNLERRITLWTQEADSWKEVV